MNEIYLNQTSVDRVTSGSAPVGEVSETELEQTIGISLLADFNQQLADISADMQSQLDEKKSVREDLSYLQCLNGRPTVQTPSGEDAVEISEEEHQKLLEMGYTDLNFAPKEGGGYYLTKDNLNATLSNKQEELAGLNANSELVMLQIQSLVDQRKTSMMLLSNLMAARAENLMGIIRNMKN